MGIKGIPAVLVSRPSSAESFSGCNILRKQEPGAGAPPFCRPKQALEPLRLMPSRFESL